VDLDERPLDRAVVANQVADAVRNADQEDRGAHAPVGERLDRVGEEDALVGVVQPVELVQEERHLALRAHFLQDRAHGVGRDIAAAEAVGSRLRPLLRPLREADRLLARAELDLAERLAPDGAEVVAHVARRAGGEHAGAAQQLGSDRCERRLAHAALAVDDGVLAGLRDDGEDVRDLLGATGEEAAPVDRRRGAECLGDTTHAVEQLRLAQLLLQRGHRNPG
jgi:hypothetical protein